jgi:hypothetical protein
VKFPPLAPDAERADGVPVEVGEEGEVEVERLRPRDVAPRRITGDGDGPDADVL